MESPEIRLEFRYPGIRVLSRIQAHALLAEFEAGIDLAKDLEHPSAEDLRWLGVCQFSVFDDKAAIDSYGQAITRGCDAARINLAHSLAFVDRAEEINSQLEQVHFERLSLYDQVFYLRVKSLHDERTGEIGAALRQAEYAWRVVQGAPEFPLLAPQLLNQLGILHGRIGRAQRALWYLDRNLELSSGDENSSVRLTRIRVLSALGHHEQAWKELAGLPDVPEQHEAIMRIRRAELAWAEGRTDRAIEEYREAKATAEKFGQSFEEFQASLDLGVLLARFADPELVEVREAFKTAQEQISDRSDRLLFRFREILLMKWEGRYEAPHASDELLALSDDLNSMGLLQEQGWVDAHAACLLAEASRIDKSAEVLDSLVALAATLQNPAFLLREWTLMPEFQAKVQESHPRIARSR